jgi:hypothetical protein
VPLFLPYTDQAQTIRKIVQKPKQYRTWRFLN